MSFAARILERDPALLTERDLQSLILDVCRLSNWRWYHTHNSKHSPSGFPDLVLAGRGRVVFAELKSEQGKLTVKQREWVEALLAAGAEVHVWRPSSWNQIVETLTGRRAVS